MTATQRYMHLSPAAVESAIRSLDQPFGNMLATAAAVVENVICGEIILFVANKGEVRAEISFVVTGGENVVGFPEP